MRRSFAAERMIPLPPKPKFTKEEITNAALTVAREKGIAAVSAREVALVLGTSTRPILPISVPWTS